MKRTFVFCLFLSGVFFSGVSREDVFAQERISLPPGVEESQARIQKWTADARAQQRRSDAQIKKRRSDLLKRQGIRVDKEDSLDVKPKEDVQEDAGDGQKQRFQDSDNDQKQVSVNQEIKKY